MGSFLIWDKTTKKVIDCIPHPTGSILSLHGLYAHRDPDYLDKYDGRDIEQTLSMGEFSHQFTLTDTLDIVTLESLKSDAEKLLDAKNAKKADIATARYMEETGGIDVGGGIVKTDRESQSQLASALVSLTNGYVTHVDWKAEGGWIELGLTDVQGISAVVSQHVQTVFSKEKTKVLEIDAATTIEDVWAISW